LKLALGPLLYYWPRDQVLSFYESIAKTPVDIVYLGETVCARRHELRMEDWLDIAARLAGAGKEVVLSTQALIESDSHLNVMRRVIDNSLYPVEANDMGAVRCLSNRQPFIAGPHLNLYNPSALQLIAGLGATRWVIPLEMASEDLEQMQKSRPEGVQTEVFAYGRMPLAFSARCFTARHRNLPKDDCRFSCIEHPDGLELQTREKQPFLVLNGIQTQSSSVYNLIGELADMRKLAVDVVRISPQAQHTESIIDLFDGVLKQRVLPGDALNGMKDLMPGASCNGYWYGRPGMDHVAA
jgi:collagenase-like PrtC family protease